MSPVSSWRADRRANARSARGWRWAHRADGSAASSWPTASLFALAGGVLGVVLAPIAMRSPDRLPACATPLPTRCDRRIDSAPAAVRVPGMSVAARCPAAGFAPALQAGRGSLISSLRERGGHGGGVRLRKVIVTLQIAFTLILVIGAVLFARTLNGLLAKGPGFDTSSLISFGIDPLRIGYSQPNPSGSLAAFMTTSALPEPRKRRPSHRYQLLTGGSWNNPMTIQSRPTNHDRSRGPSECGHARILRDARNQHRRRARLRRARRRGPPVTRAAARRQLSTRRSRSDTSAGAIRSARLDLSGYGARRQPDIEDRRGRRQHQLSRYSRGVGAGVLPAARRQLRQCGTFYVRVQGTPEAGVSVDSVDPSQGRSDVADQLSADAG